MVGLAIEWLVYRPLRHKKAANLIYLIASFGVFIFLQNLLQLIYGAQILTIRTGTVVPGHNLGGAVITNTQLLILAACLMLTVAVWFYLQKTRLGTSIRAVADDPLAAGVVGISADRTISIVFFIGSMLASAAGILISLETNLEPTMGMNAILKGMIAAIIGGIGSVGGAVVGGFFLGLAENLGIWKISAGWKDCIAFSVLILFLLVRPSGFFGRRVFGDRM